MHMAILLAASALGIDYGWQPRDGGGFEYIIQIEPELLDSLRAGEELRSDLPPFMRDVRSYRIICGRNPVPKLGNPEAAAPPVERRPNEPTPAAAREEPAETPPRGNPWSPPKSEEASPPIRAPRNDRYPDFQFRTETSEPKPRASEPPAPVNDDPPRPFLPDPSSTALVKQTSGFHGAGEGAHDHAHETTAAAKSTKAEESAKPWLPLTATLLCLFVSMGGNAYLGLQWWATRLRCIDLLRDRRGASNRTPLKKREREPDIKQEYNDAANETDEQPEEDDEDQDVRAIDEEEPAPQKRRR